jgi:DNA polymerase III subunit delta'
VSEPEQSADDPRLTSDLVGHAAAEQALLDLWNRGRMPHAVMLSGRPGVGKATLGYRLARFVLAGTGGGGLFTDAPASLHLPPESPTFRRVASGGHVDLVVLERPWDEKRGRRRGVIPMELAQKVVSFLRLTSGEGGWRVVLVDAVDDLNPSSANALLKVLEEPPPQVLLILIANAPGKVLPTIRSRCRQLALSPLSEAETAAVVAAKRATAVPAERALAVALAEGSPGQALALLEQGAAAVYGELIALLATLPDYPFGKALAFADKVGTAGDDAPFAVFGDVFTGWLARLLRGAVEGAPNGPGGEEKRLNARLAAAGALDPWFEVWDKAATWFAETEGLNLDRKQAVLAVIEACATAARRSAATPGPAGARA